MTLMAKEKEEKEEKIESYPTIDWFYKNTTVLETPEQYTGFVYIIKERKSPYNYYVGRKTFWTTEKKSPTKYKRKDGKYLKDKNNKRILNTRTTKTHKKVESDWKDYWGSSDKFLEYIEEKGKEHFVRQILYLCEGKFWEAYYEAKTQFDMDVLFDDNSFNGIINCRIGKVPKKKEEK